MAIAYAKWVEQYTHWPIKIVLELSFKMYLFFIIISGHHRYKTYCT